MLLHFYAHTYLTAFNMFYLLSLLFIYLLSNFCPCRLEANDNRAKLYIFFFYNQGILIFFLFMCHTLTNTSETSRRDINYNKPKVFSIKKKMALLTIAKN